MKGQVRVDLLEGVSEASKINQIAAQLCLLLVRARGPTLCNGFWLFLSWFMSHQSCMYYYPRL